MSSGHLLVVMYPDLAIRFGHYSATSDVVQHGGALYLDPQCSKAPAESPIDLQWDVEVFANYGGGIRWRGSASRWCLDTTEPYGHENPYYPAEKLDEAEDVADGPWEWVDPVWRMVFGEGWRA